MFYLYNCYLCFSRTSRRVETCGYPKEDKQWRSSFKKKGHQDLETFQEVTVVIKYWKNVLRNDPLWNHVRWSQHKRCFFKTCMTWKISLTTKKRNNRKHRNFSLLWWFCYCVCDEKQINPGRNLSWKLIREYSISMQSITREQKEKKALFRLSITGDFPPASFGGQRRGNAIETHY